LTAEIHFCRKTLGRLCTRIALRVSALSCINARLEQFARERQNQMQTERMSSIVTFFEQSPSWKNNLHPKINHIA